MKNAYVYTLNEAAMLLKVKPITIRRLILKRILPRLPDIGHIRIPCEAVERFARQNTLP